ncbi:hypothetical protein [Niabella ginsengisoli]|uniref:PH domain-containing protein n=1 Tax=Niabella ginsengisoli TaxID=522298 RepID=A0ABS9SMC6_9BACT|nr:hypothetical protein [Niabella ginsengisoli]MCH5599535.1 hypothetical protein [Niabella ginsengisoli]
MEFVTVSQAVKKAGMMIALPVCIVLCFPMIIMIIMSTLFSIAPLWGIITIVGSFILAILTGMYCTLKWEIWALKNVADVHALKSRIESQLFSTGFPSKWIIGSKHDKELIKQLWEDRALRNPVYKPAISYDYTLPEEMIITGSRMQNAILIFCCVGLIYISSTSIFAKVKLSIIVAIESLIGLYFLYKTIAPAKKFTLSAKGIWTKKTGVINWENVFKIYIWDDIGQGFSKVEKFSVIQKGLITQKKKAVVFAIKDINISSSRLEYIIKNYLFVYNKKAINPLYFG